MRNNLAAILRKHILDISNENTDDKDLLVADIAFAYDNGDLVNLLIKRGAAIKANDQVIIDSLNSQIRTLVRKGQENGSLLIPVKAYITFETERAYNLMQDSEVNLCGRLTNFQATDEPTNIIWEN